MTGTIAASVTLTDSQGAETTLYESNDVGELSKPLSIPIGADVALGEATVTTSVTVTTAPTTGADGSRINGTTLAPTKATTEVTINPPLDFPALSAPVDFGRLEKDTTAGGFSNISLSVIFPLFMISSLFSSPYPFSASPFLLVVVAE